MPLRMMDRAGFDGSIKQAGVFIADLLEGCGAEFVDENGGKLGAAFGSHAMG